MILKRSFFEMEDGFNVILQQYTTNDGEQLYKIATISNDIDISWEQEGNIKDNLLYQYAIDQNVNEILLDKEIQTENTLQAEESEVIQKNNKSYSFRSPDPLPKLKNINGEFSSSMIPFSISKIDYENDFVFVKMYDEEKDTKMKYSDALCLFPELICQYFAKSNPQ